jgi:alkaline phosphatase
MENYAEYWKLQGQMKIRELIDKQTNKKDAKNVIMFVGDGMSFGTIAATRMLLGGESESLSFEKFPHIGFSKVNFF